MRALVRFSAAGDTVDEISKNLRDVWDSLHPGSEFPRDAEVIPLPRPETTPPVTNMYLVT